ncbi:MAG: hypothetical protein R3Y56_01780 [Akkermansia sp.]
MKARLSKLAQFAALILGIVLCWMVMLDVGNRDVAADTDCQIYCDYEFDCYRLSLPSKCRKTQAHSIYNSLDALRISKLCLKGRDLYAVIDMNCLHVDLDANQVSVLPEEPAGLTWVEAEEFWNQLKR